ncbi:hypothetical protein [Nocardia sp. BMG51109]|uniref:hypothetical protein n=1 Tax=Nocardia sp. BMG51109 TaxID=1056816 RepID=UPI0012EB3046|nr:hypothetical protein [Nocardia sp. BMG51109]
MAAPPMSGRYRFDASVAALFDQWKTRLAAPSIRLSGYKFHRASQVPALGGAL